MNDMGHVSLTPSEYKIVQGLREIPDSALRYRLEEALVQLTDFVRDPHCAETQADGVPCPTPDQDCHLCLKVNELIEMVRSSIPRS